MALLKTLEGTSPATSINVNDLFDVNDVLGCMLYGPQTWNQIKSYACNRALELLASKNDFGTNLSKIAGKKNYIIRNDILDKVFGFNHVLGCELYGAEDWDEFVRDVKTTTPPTLGSVKGALKSLVKPSGVLYPENFTAKGILQWLFVPGATNIADATTQFGSKGASAKAADAKVANARNQVIATQEYANQVQQDAAEKVAQAKQEFSAEYARTKASEDSINEKNKELQYSLQTNPEYMANKSKNIIMLCCAGLLAAVILKGSK